MTESRQPRHLVIVLLGALGDVVRGLSLLDVIKEQMPTTRITWVVEPAAEPIVRLHSGVGRIVVFQRKRWWRSFPSIVRELRSDRADVCLDLQRHAKSGLISFFSGAPRRIGFHRHDAKEGNWLFNTEYIEAFGESISKVEHYLKFAEKLGLAPRPAKVRGLTPPSDGALPHGLSGSYAGLVLGSSWDSKDWPEEGYKGLIERWSLPGVDTVVLLGDKTKAAMGERLEGARGACRVVNLAGKTSLKELVAVLSRAAVCIGPDSGPGHLCGALGTPHVTLFGPTPAVRNAPLGSEHLTTCSRVGCSPCKRRVCPGLDKVCMRLISPESVLELVRRAVRS